MLTRFAAVVAFVWLATVSIVVADVDVKNKTDDQGNKVTYDGAQLLRIEVVDDSVQRKLGELEEAEVVKTWGSSKTGRDVMVKGGNITEVKDFLQSKNASFQVIIEDIQKAIKDENPDYDDLFWNDRHRPYRLSWLRYHRYDDHLQYMSYLQTEHAKLVSIIDIGESVEGRPLKVIKISSGQPDAKAIWIDGGTHAREWISPATATYIVKELVENRPVHEAAISGLDFYVAPIINPDGYEYTHTVDRLWRKNRSKKGGYCSGTDLNRNWGYKWGGAGSSKQPCKEIYAGSSAFSEPETKAVSNFILSKKDSIKAYVTFHSYGQYILYPWGYGAKVPPDYADLERVGRKAAAAIQGAGGPAYTVGNSASTLYPASGGADDWAKGVAGIKFTYTIELRDNGVYGFVLPAQFIEPTGKETLAAIKAIAEEVIKL